MGLFERIRGVFANQEAILPEHLEGYKRIGDQVYEAKVELAGESDPRVKLLIRIAESFQVMGNALLRNVRSENAIQSSTVPRITQEQAEQWYGRIPDLLISARKESIAPGSSHVVLPVQMGQRVESETTCPLSHLAGLRRAAHDLEDLIISDISYMRADKEKYRQILLLYEEARTRRNTGDALMGSIMSGKNVPHETHEEAKEQYWAALSNNLLVLQGVENPLLLSEFLSPKSKLDSDDVWKVTAQLAIEDMKESNEYERTQGELEEFWTNRETTDEERQYETTVERLLDDGLIQENGYWYRLPFQPVYLITATQVKVLGKAIPKGHEFVWDYLQNSPNRRLLTRAEFRYSDKRDH